MQHNNTKKDKQPKLAVSGKAKSSKKSILVIGGVSLTILILLVLIFTGVIKLPSWGSQTQKACDNSVIENYNKTKDDSALVGNWSKELATISEQIRNTEGFEGDVDCLYILNQDAMEKRQWSIAHYYLLEIKQKIAATEGVKISDKLTSLTSEQMESYLNYRFLIGDQEVDVKAGE